MDRVKGPKMSRTTADEERPERWEVLVVADRRAVEFDRDVWSSLQKTESSGLDGTVLAILTGYLSLNAIRQIVVALLALRHGVLIDAREEPLTIRSDSTLPTGSVTIRQPDGQVEFVPPPESKSELSGLLEKILGK
jgi:hypothetical protein